MATSREQMVEMTCTLIERQGYHATGLNQILQESGAPKGSLYYHFPAGKDELFAEAIGQLGQRVAARIRANLSGEEPPALLVSRFVRRIAEAVEASAYEMGGPLMTVAMETATSSERLNQACGAAYAELRAAFAGALTAAVPEARALEIATFVLSAIEGGVLLSRTYHTGDPLRRVAEELSRYLSATLEQDAGGME